MRVDGPGRLALRIILGAMPPAERAEYAGELLEMANRRGAEVRGQLMLVRFWLRELVAATAAVIAAWIDSSRRRPLLAPRVSGGAGRRLLQDVRFTGRALRRSPRVAGLVVGTLAVAIAAVLTIFSMIDGLLLRPIPVPEPERLVRVFEVPDSGPPVHGTSYPALQEYRSVESLDGPAGWTTMEAGLLAGDVSDRVAVGLVSGDFFTVLQLGPHRGRLLHPSDDQAAAPPVVVLGYEFWQRTLVGDSDILGSLVEISGTSFVVVGITAPGFKGVTLEESPDLWVPLSRVRQVASSGLYAAPNILDTRAFAWISMVARLPEGADRGVEEAKLDQLGRRARAEGMAIGSVPEEQLVRLRPLATSAAIGDREALLRFVGLLSGVVMLTLVIACLNAAVLISTNAWRRDLELGVRLALGASRSRLIRQLLLENLALALCGAGSGIALAALTGRALQGFSLPGGVSVARLDLTPDARMAGVAVLLAALSAVAFGLGPVLFQSRRDVAERLRAEGRGVLGPVRGLSSMIVAQVGLSLVLIVGALLFVRTLAAALDTPLGFEPHGVAAISFAFQGHGYGNAEIPAAVHAILDAAEASPAIAAAAVASHVPLAPPRTRLKPIPENAPDDWPATAVAFNVVSGAYFDVLGVEVVFGRVFSRSEDAGDRDLGVLNESAAELLFPGEDPVGQRFVIMRGLDPVEVVGVVKDHKVHSVADTAVPQVYLSADHWAGIGLATGTHLVARANGSTTDALRVLREELRAFDSTLPTYDARALDRQLGRVLMPQRFGAWLLGLLAAVNLLVSSVGIYAVVAFGVRRRTTEIGLRIALGAGPGRVLAEAMHGMARAMALGVVVGVGLAAGLVRFVAGYLYGVPPLDPGAFAGGVLLLVAVGLGAALRPALRAQRIDPIRAIADG